MAEGDARLARGLAEVVGVLGLLILVGLMVGYAVTWSGGAMEVTAGDLRPEGGGCHYRDDSDTVMGVESSQWVGGGLFGVPGRLCTYEEQPAMEFTAYDLLGAALGFAAFICTVPIGAWYLYARRGRDS